MKGRVWQLAAGSWQLAAPKKRGVMEGSIVRKGFSGGFSTFSPALLLLPLMIFSVRITLVRGTHVCSCDLCETIVTSFEYQ